MGHVGREEEVGEEKEKQVEEPEAEDGDRGEGVETDVGAARLDGVADESVLLVTEEGEPGQQENQQAENQHQHPPAFTFSTKRVGKKILFRNLMKNI